MKFHAKFLMISIAAGLMAYSWRDTFEAESLRGARVLVTGASTGIGEQLAYQYARFGAQIVITARRERVLREVAARCLKLGAQKVLYVAADMGLTSDPERVVKFAVDKLGGLDYLVLNHIGPSPFAMWDGDVEHTRWLMQVNFLSYMQMTSAALPSLEKSGGTIVVVSSLLGKMCTPFVGPYSATKFSVNGFFGVLQHELAMQRKNVSITISVLGLIDTQSALEKVKGYTNMTAHPAHEAALHIIKAGATHQAESFYPWYMYITCLFRDWFPFFRDLVIKNSYYYEP
ncbi:hydroxysteroid 11-beta-dehydrogenase 1-like protein [Megalops cyprinoides]|uniref:hydroxysteroid 11-beta-dehydrogenase 1-like protein n=1 Tax=Megalops cyprinoides TaxID=118141 RepID=UPI001864B7A7|nr:hydroxysteroid 11-beta-dehydrogenase 1-like protein [Megalops cyprinoides]